MRKALFAAIACGCLTVHAQEARWYTQIDNDVFYGTDRWYTSGLRVARVQPFAGYSLEYGVLQEIYTPEAKRPNPIDRPPAARLLATVARHDRDGASWRTLELDAGVQGPAALGRQAQAVIHRIFPAPHEHWDQERPSRLDAQLVAVLTQPLAVLGPSLNRFNTFNAHYGAVLGNEVQFAHAGLEWRFGPDGAARTMSSPLLRFAATPPTPAQPPSGGTWNAFIAESVRDVIRNDILDRRGDSFLPPLERRHYIRRFSTGIVWINRWSTLSFGMAIDSREFVGQRRNDGFGSLVLELPF